MFNDEVLTLKNDALTIEVNTKGAELMRVVKDGTDYLWSGHPMFWQHRAPLLFPVIDAMTQLGRQGFAHEMDFEVLHQTAHEVGLKLQATDETRKQYPFEFELRMGYVLEDTTVKVTWEVINLGETTLPFAIGACPAFATESDLSDYALQLKDSQGIEAYVVDQQGWVDFAAGKTEIIENLPFLPLSQDLFEAYPLLILEGESEIMLRSYTHDREVEVGFDGFPYVGIWSPINEAGQVAPFVCIAPWHGLVDTTDTMGELAEKKGIQLLQGQEKLTATYRMTFK
ncbi:MAG: hypothetical protein FWG67_09150 [Defluviitaleaceae bacterium]|nr:hypothetical protein [Defluviitaleaceae bacterium]